jgi:hypothetical protein
VAEVQQCTGVQAGYYYVEWHLNLVRAKSTSSIRHSSFASMRAYVYLSGKGCTVPLLYSIFTHAIYCTVQYCTTVLFFYYSTILVHRKQYSENRRHLGKIETADLHKSLGLGKIGTRFGYNKSLLFFDHLFPEFRICFQGIHSKD